jgi:eukaryotic-like serine/threonine-protein kinase
MLWVIAAVVAFASPAWAVVPGLTGPLQALGQLLPQLLPFLAAGLAGALSIPSWRARLKRFGGWLTTTRGLACFAAALAVTTGAVLLARGGDRSQIAVAAPSASAAVKASDWPMFRGDLSRTGAAPAAQGAPAGPAQGKVLWSFRDPDARAADLSSSPAVAGNRIYAASAQASVFDSSGMVYCLDAATGKQIWRFQTEKQVFSSPAVAGGKVYVGEGLHVDTGCRVYCLDAATGKKLWAATTKSHTESSPAVADGKVFIGAGEDGVYCLDAATGKQLWHYPGTHVDVSPAVAGGKVYVGTGYGRLAAIALDAATGKPAWTTPCDLPVWGPPAVDGDRVFYGTGNGDFVKSAANPRGAVWCLEAGTGKQVWRRNLPDAVLTAVLLHNGKAYVGCRDGRIYCLDAATGAVAWSAPCGGPVVASPATDGRTLYVAGGKGQLHAFNLASGKPAWTLDLVPHTAADVQLFSSPALAGGRLFLGTSKEKLFCIGP